MGFPWRKIFSIAGNIAPMIIPFGGVAGRVARAVSESVITVESVIDSGEDKHEQARIIIGRSLDIAEEAIGKDVLDDDLVSDAVDKTIEVEVAVKNAYAALKVAVESYQFRSSQ